MNISKRTAQRMLQNIDSQLQALAAEQQALNNNSKGKTKMLYGGYVPKLNKATSPNSIFDNNMFGGYTMLPSNWASMSPGFGMDKYNIDFGNTNLDINPSRVPHIAIPGSDGGITKTAPTAIPTKGNITSTGNIGGMNSHLADLIPTLGKRFSTTTLAPAPTVPNKTKGDFGYNDLMGLSPTIFNAIAGLTSPKADFINHEQYQNPYESQAFSLMPDQFRIDDILNDNRNAYGTYLKNVNQVGNSRGERMANYTAGMNRMNEANGKAWALKNNMENEMSTNKAQLRNNQGMVRANTKLKVRDMNDANSAAARNARMAYLGAAASGLQTYGLTKEQQSNQYKSQMAYIEALKRNAHFNEWLGLDKLIREYGQHK